MKKYKLSNLLCVVAFLSGSSIAHADDTIAGVLFGAPNQQSDLLVGFASSVVSQTVNVPASGVLVDLGSFTAGTYQLIGGGLIDTGGLGTSIFRPDGIPNTPITDPSYGYLNPNGGYTDVLLGNATGRAGFNAKLGSLIGTLNTSAFTGINPTTAQANDWFLIGYDHTITLASTQHIYASVNDSFYSNNRGAFTLNVAVVPEPATWLLFASGCAVLLGARSRMRTVA